MVFEGPHAYFLDRLLPVRAELLDAAISARGIRAGTDALTLMRGAGTLCTGAGSDPGDDARRPAGVLVDGLRAPR